MVWVNLAVGQTIYIECGYYYTTGGTTYALWGVGPGFDCWNPIPVNLPADVPYSNTNTTCGKINYYSETCLGSYDEGQDILYQLNVSTSGVFVDISLTSNASWVGMCIDENCPPDLSCINMCTSYGSACSMTNVYLPTGTYYLMIDTWPLPDCIPQFTLNITPVCSQLSGALWGTLTPGLYCIVGDIWVSYGDLLTLQPGTTFRFDGPYAFRIYGTLSALGTASDSIVFTTELTDTNRWRGLRFEGVESSASQLAYCRIEKGYARIDRWNYDGGGLYFDSSSPSLSYCTIINNWAQNNGGGMYCANNSSPSLLNCSFSGNSASYGGAAYIWESSPTLTNCTMSGNSAIGGYGGGVSCGLSSSTFTNCSFIGNWTNSGAGGIYLTQYAAATLANCLIRGNSANQGGGIFFSGHSSPTLVHCTLTDNLASGGEGGAIYIRESQPIVKSAVCAFSTGSGIYFDESPATQIGNCDFYGNSNGDFQYFLNDPTNGPPELGPLTMTNANGDSCDEYFNIFLDPTFVNRPGGDFHLTDASHCIGAGNPSSPPPIDFEGDPRPNPPGTNPDIGMDENPNAQPLCELAGFLEGTIGSGLCHVVADIWVDAADTLTILPGTTFLFDGPYYFSIQGKLFAQGTVSDSIVFTTEQTGSDRWGGLRFEGSGSTGSQLAYCLIEKAYHSPQGEGGGVYCSDNWVNFTHCIILATRQPGVAEYFVTNIPRHRSRIAKSMSTRLRSKAAAFIVSSAHRLSRIVS
jgi:parallel beta-helix repeat protein